MKTSATSGGAPWKWDTTLLDREGWKCDSSQCGDLWKLDDGTIVTMSAITTHLGENDKNHRTSADVVRWHAPPKP